jgi:hypothetical protein
MVAFIRVLEASFTLKLGANDKAELINKIHAED